MAAIVRSEKENRCDEKHKEKLICKIKKMPLPKLESGI
jgi:hypothetical protein